MSYDRIAGKLAKGEIIIIDGGTGTDIQSRGVPMAVETWCAEANLTHPAVVRCVHEDYITAGAEIVTANTYPTSPLLFNALGRVPARGEVVQAIPGFEFHVLDADPRRVKRVRIVQDPRGDRRRRSAVPEEIQ